MKHLSSLLATLLYTASVYAVDPMGSHRDSDGGGLNLPVPLMLGLLFVVSIIGIIMGKSYDKQDGSKMGCLGYVGLAASILGMVFTCSH